jgi:uncharacterized membrane protein
MKENSRIRFNPVTKEIEIEGSESFVKAYFSKLQEMISGSPERTMTVKEKPVKAKAVPKKKAKVAKTSSAKKGFLLAKPSPVKRTQKVAKKEPGQKKVTNIDAVVTLIQKSSEGISTAVLKEKTGLAESQIWNIVNRATKEGKISKMKRGLYGKV